MCIPNHETRSYTGVVLERIKALRPGGRMVNLPEHLQHKSFVRRGAKKTGGPSMRIIRLEMDKPSLTVTTNIFNKFVHPIEDRYITPREAAMLQDFPIDYAFIGPLGQVHKQIGNAVPVNLARAVASSVAEYLYRCGRTSVFKIASYFTGAGGLDLGFEQASTDRIRFETVFSTDINKSAGATIEHNRPGWGFHRADITKLTCAEVRERCGGFPDILVGGPPCQPFSVAGKQRATEDPLGLLYSDFVRHVKGLSPEIVVMENVYGLAQVKKSNMVGEIYKSFTDIGYTVQHRELIAADFGTPQKRRRLFFVATKQKGEFNFPKPTHHETSPKLQKHVGVGSVFDKLTTPMYRTR